MVRDKNKSCTTRSKKTIWMKDGNGKIARMNIESIYRKST